jgi:hypothetical protein
MSQNSERTPRREANIEIAHEFGKVLGGREKVATLILFLDEDGYCQLTATEQAANHFYYPASIRFFRDLMWRRVLPRGVAGIANVARLYDLARRLDPLVRVVREGHSIEQHDGQLIGALSPAAQRASQDIQRMLNAADWLIELEPDASARLPRQSSGSAH